MSHLFIKNKLNSIAVKNQFFSWKTLKSIPGITEKNELNFVPLWRSIRMVFIIIYG